MRAPPPPPPSPPCTLTLTLLFPSSSCPDFEDDSGSRDGSYVGYDDAYDMDEGGSHESHAPANKKNPFNRDRRNSSEQRGKDGVHAF